MDGNRNMNRNRNRNGVRLGFETEPIFFIFIAKQSEKKEHKKHLG